MKEKIRKLIEQYTQFLRENPGNPDEVYKWEAIIHFRRHWNPEAENFWEMFREAFRKHYNLAHHFAFNFFKTLGEYDDKKLKHLILSLYDENTDLKTRFFRHKELADAYMQEINAAKGTAHKHFQDDRTIAFLLAFRYPEKYYIYKSTVHKHLCEYLGIPKVNGFYKQYHHFADLGDEFLPYIRQNKELQERAAGFIPPEFKFDSTLLLFQDMAYQMLEKKKRNKMDILEILKNPGNRKFWQYSPGEQARKWDEFYEKGIMGIGWDEIGDLRRYKNRREIEEAIKDAYNEHDKNKIHDSLANDEFLNLMKPGDIVIAKKGMNKLIGYGIVTSDYMYDSERDEYQKIRKVKWLKKGEWSPHKPLARKTLTEIQDFNELKKYIEIMEDIYFVNTDETKPVQSVRHPLNQILYGPPGTGKTYKTKELAVKIIDGTAPKDRAALNERFNELQNAGQIGFVSFHQSMNYEDFIEGIKPALKNNEVIYEIQDGIFKQISAGARQNPDKKFVLIIDEINRANVSAVFGELISLIEPDKRTGRPEALEAHLPYSKKRFGVPDNLYLIGTMNTADRSVEALDTALRRRFSFMELMPDPALLRQRENDEIFPGIRKSDILETINRRIEVLLDRDHTIGHSYFMDANTPEELARIFNDKILPLLQEYFYDDYAKIGMILGKTFVYKEKNSRDFADFDTDFYFDIKEYKYRLRKACTGDKEEYPCVDIKQAVTGLLNAGSKLEEKE